VKTSLSRACAATSLKYSKALSLLASTEWGQLYFWIAGTTEHRTC
jgi:hypothetical protein